MPNFQRDLVMYCRRFAVLFATLAVCCCQLSFGQDTLERPKSKAEKGASSEAAEAAADVSSKQDAKKEKDGWISLLPEKGLEGWEPTDFGSKGEVKRDGDMLVIEMGDPLNGVNYTKKDFPTENFEIVLEAQRVEGADFLCGLTFPVGKEFCSFVAGGWGGTVVGLSSMNGFDASENETSTFKQFENGKWYKFKVRVDDKQITTWIDDEELFVVDREGNEFSTRIEVYSSQPLGFCAFQSKVLVRDFKWRSIGAVKKDEATKPQRSSRSLVAPTSDK